MNGREKEGAVGAAAKKIRLDQLYEGHCAPAAATTMS